MLAMKHVMASEGYAGASMAAVAKQAGLKQGLLHYHCTSKQEMLLALGAHLTQVVEQRYAARLKTADTPIAALEAWLAAHLQTGEDQDLTAVRCWVVLGAEALSQPEVATLYRALLRARRTQLTALVKAAFGETRPHKARVDVVVTSLLACVEGLFRLGVTAPETVQEGSAVAVATTTLHALLQGR